jgi:hypothetical protein
VLHWYGSRSGWQALTALRWAILVTVLAAFALVLTQVACRAPAMPVSLGVVVLVLAMITVVWLAIHVLIAMPAHQKATVVLGLVSAIGIFWGAYLSLRDEGISPRDAPSDIPVVRLGGP